MRVGLSEFSVEETKQFKERLARIYLAIGSDKPGVLARKLGIKAPSVAAACKRQQIPGGWVEAIAMKYGVSADWLFFGIGSMKIGVATPMDDILLDQPEGKSEQVLRARIVELEIKNGALMAENSMLEKVVMAKEEALLAKEEALLAKGESLNAYKEMLRMTREGGETKGENSTTDAPKSVPDVLLTGQINE